MKKLLAVLVVGIALGTTGVASAASFDCSKASTSVEKAICRNPALSSLDEQLAQSYKSRLAKDGESSSVKTDQQRWLREQRNKCKDDACLSAAYNERLVVLGANDRAVPTAPVQNAGATKQQQTTQSPPQTDCDIYGADRDDPQKVATGLSDDQLDANKVIAVCTDALKQYPNSARFQYQLGRAYGVKKQYDMALDLYEKSAAQGYASGQNALGNMYYTGDGVPQDDKEAVKWFRLAAEQGYAYGQFMLGGMYFTGNGVPHDYKEAVKWFRLAAEQGNAYGQDSLGEMYRDGSGVPQDDKDS